MKTENRFAAYRHDNRGAALVLTSVTTLAAVASGVATRWWMSLAFLLWCLHCGAIADPLLTYPIKIRGHDLRVEVAHTEDSRRRGLMFRHSLPENYGMIFVYDEPGPNAMWMKNTRIPLSVAFLDSEGRILNIEDMAPHTEIAHASRGDAKYALEVNRGWFSRRGLRPGEFVKGLQRLPPAQ